MEMNILQELENIYKSENRKWETIKKLIIKYKKKTEEQRLLGMQMMSLILESPIKKINWLSESIKPEQTIELIHCILEDINIPIEKCKDCKNQCVNYLKR